MLLRDLRVSVSIGEETYAVRDAEIREALSTITEARVVVHTTDSPDTPAWLDRHAVILVCDGLIERRRFSLRVAAANPLGASKGYVETELILRSSLHFLELWSDVRKFRDMTTLAVVRAVFASRGVAHAVEIAAEPALLPYCTQYRETDLAFVSRLLEHEGFFYEIDASDDVVHLGDDTTTASSVDGPPFFEIHHAGGALGAREDGITDVWRAAEIGSGAVTLGDYDWKRPALPLRCEARGARDAQLERYEFYAGFRSDSVGGRLARSRLEAHRALTSRIEGAGSVLAFAPNRRMSLVHDDAVAFSGGYVVVAVTHVVEAPSSGEPPLYKNTFTAIPEEVRFRPIPRTPVPRIRGTHSVMVRGPEGELIHTDTHGRFKGQFHWDREATGTDRDSRWMRMMQESSSSLVLARVGWEVAVGYIAGDPDRPVGLGRHINGEMTPTYTQPAKKEVLTIKTETYPSKDGFNEIRLDDTAGSMRFDVRAERELQDRTLHDKRETILRDHTHGVGPLYARRVHLDQQNLVGGDRTVRVGQDRFTTTTGGRETHIAGNDSHRVKSDLQVVVSRNDSESVGSIRSTIVGGIQKPVLAAPVLPGIADLKASLPGPANLASAAQGGLQSLLPKPPSLASSAGALKSLATPPIPSLGSLLVGTLSKTAGSLLLRTVGGAHVALAGDALTMEAGEIFNQAVGGAKISKVKGNILVRAGRVLSTIAGGLMQKAGGDVATSSSSSSSRVLGNASFSVADVAELRSDEVTLEARSSLKLRVGAAELEMTPGGVVIRGDLHIHSANRVDVHGNPDDLTR